MISTSILFSVSTKLFEKDTISNFVRYFPMLKVLIVTLELSDALNVPTLTV